MEQLVKQAIEQMRRKGFEVVEVETAADAKAFLLSSIGAEQSVGVGGSVTIRDTDVLDALRQKGCNVVDPWTAEDRAAAKNACYTTDVYLTSANAVTKNGEMVFIDGTGNRVSAIADGPRTAFFVVSESKFVDGGIHTAVARIKKVACPRNARRIGLQTPCALTGVCREPECEDGCICRMTLQLDRAPKDRRMVAVIVEEALGY